MRIIFISTSMCTSISTVSQPHTAWLCLNFLSHNTDDNAGKLMSCWWSDIWSTIANYLSKSYPSVQKCSCWILLKFWVQWFYIIPQKKKKKKSTKYHLDGYCRLLNMTSKLKNIREFIDLLGLLTGVRKIWILELGNSV